MNLPRLCIRRPVGCCLLALGLVLLGAAAWRHLPVASLPQVDYPVIEVSASLPGASPESISGTVAAPLERCLLYTSPSPRDKRQSRMPSSA